MLRTSLRSLLQLGVHHKLVTPISPVPIVSGITLKDGYSSFIFPIGSVVYRSWSKYDHDVFSDHISDLEDEKVDKAFGVAIRL